MITEAIVKAAALAAFEAESQKWAVRYYKEGDWALCKAPDLSAAGAVVGDEESLFVFRTQDEAESEMREKIVRAVLTAIDRVYMGVKADA